MKSKTTKWFCMPADFDLATLDYYAGLSKFYPDSIVCETYGNLNPSPFGSGRAKSSPYLPNVNIAELETYISRSHQLGIDFNYTLNSACLGGAEFTQRGRRRIISFVDTLMKIGVKTFTVALPSLVPILKAHCPSIVLCSSLICEIESVPAAKMFESLGYDRLIIDDSIVRRFDIINALNKNLNIPLEVLVNNTCLFNCPWKSFHYGLLSHSDNLHDKDLELYYHWQCMAIRTESQEELLLLRWIRPEDINKYENVKYFKVVGRYHAQQADLRKTALSYISGSFDGNLWDLLGNFAPQRRHGFIINNKKLENFLDYFINNPGVCKDTFCKDCGYCKFFAERAVSKSSLQHVKKHLKLSELEKKIDAFHRVGRPISFDEERVFKVIMGLTQ